jgi:hypothetical protein
MLKLTIRPFSEPAKPIWMSLSLAPSNRSHCIFQEERSVWCILAAIAERKNVLAMKAEQVA